MEFSFESFASAPDEEIAHISDLYFEAGIIDSPRDRFAALSMAERKEILSLYRNEKFLKIFFGVEWIGIIGHGVRAESDMIMISYLFLPRARGRDLFGPMIAAFGTWCGARYPDKKFFRANTEKTNTASIRSLQKAGFDFFEEKMDGPSDGEKVLFSCFRKKIS